MHQLDAPEYFKHTKKAGTVYFQMKWIPHGEAYTKTLDTIKESPIADGYLILNFKYALNLINRSIGIREELPNPYIRFKPIGAFENPGPDDYYTTAVANTTTEPVFNEVIRVQICTNKEEGAYINLMMMNRDEHCGDFEIGKLQLKI